MRPGVLLLLATLAVVDIPTINADQAKDLVDKECILRIDVRSYGSSAKQGVKFLNSCVDYRDPQNVSVFVPDAVVDELARRFKFNSVQDLIGTTLLVHGKVFLHKDKYPSMAVENANAIDLAGRAPVAVNLPPQARLPAEPNNFLWIAVFVLAGLVIVLTCWVMVLRNRLKRLTVPTH